MTNCVGVIAEDTSDVEVVKALISKIVPGVRVSIKSMVGRGGGRILGKCFPWARDLRARGCSMLIVVHDLDDKIVVELSEQLRQKLHQCAIPRRVVVIPIREIEAWLLSDNHAIHSAMGLVQMVPPVPNPQEILDPKRKLGEIIYFRSGKTKRYVNAAHNARIAAAVDLANIRRCPSFRPLERFVLDNIR